jgi:undecaprenyl-diphosphatase
MEQSGHFSKLLPRFMNRKKQLPETGNRHNVWPMTLENIFILAVIQGITEFLPISSSGHLSLLHNVTSYPDQGVMIDVALHAGTLLAVLAYFRADVATVLIGVWNIIRGKDGTENKLAWAMVIATVPILIGGGLLLASGYADVLRSAQVIAWASIIFAIPLYLCDRCVIDKTIADVDGRFALWVGLSQILALIPGASRSGVTMTAARALGLSREDAARFSMLMACPVIFLFALAGFYDLMSAEDPGRLQDGLIAGGLAAIIAFVSIHLFIKLTKRLSFLPFVIYRIGLGTAILLFV